MCSIKEEAEVWEWVGNGGRRKLGEPAEERCLHPVYQDLRCPAQAVCDVRGLGVGGGERGWEFELSTLVWRLGRSGCNMTWARGQSLRAKVTLPPANGVAAGRPRWGWVTLPRNPHPSSGSRLEQQVPVCSQ